VNILGSIEAEAHLKLMFGEQSGHILAHEGPVGLNPVLKRKLGILSLEADDSAIKIEACQKGLTAVPVDLNYLVERINGQIVGDDAAQNRLNRREADNTPGMLLEAIPTRQVAVPSYLDLGHHREMVIPIGTAWLYGREIFHHGNEKGCEALDLFRRLGKSHAR
jgi:hypothetical protein